MTMTRRGFFARCAAIAGAMLLPAVKAVGVEPKPWWWPTPPIQWETMDGLRINFKVFAIGRGTRPIRSGTVVCKL